MADALRAKALACLAQREHSRAELRRHLLRWLTLGPRPARRSKAARSAHGEGGEPNCAQPSDLAYGADEADEAPRPAHEAQVDALLDALAEQGWLNEARFIEMRLHARAPQWGVRRIAQELHSHGLALDDQAKAQLRQTERDRALALWQRRYGLRAESAAEAARQARFLAARGFSGEVIREVLKSAAALLPDTDGEPGDLP